MEDTILKILLGWNLGVILGWAIFVIFATAYLVWFHWYDIIEFLRGCIK